MDKFILAPGPTQCRQTFLDILSKPVMYHRCHDFRNLYGKTRELLCDMMGLTHGESLILTCSGTGAMEASVANFFNPKDEVLVISIGHFGHRFNEICQAYQLNVTMLDFPLGQSYDYDIVSQYITSHPNLKGVFITHHETSSGVLNQLEPIGKLLEDREDCLLIVDSISGFLVHPTLMDDWHIDCLLASSQKGFLIPPGLAVVGLSQKALNCLNLGSLPRYYNDFRKYINMFEINETPFTPNVALIEALHAACLYLTDYGLEKYYNDHHQRRLYLASKLEALGLDVNFVDEKDRGDVLVLVKLKDGMNAKEVHDALDDAGFIVATGFSEYKTTMLRIGVIGDVTFEDLDRFIITLKDVLHKLYQY